jgi:anti-sigma B factor antagonist
VLGRRDHASPVPGGEPACEVAELGTCVQLTVSGELDLAAAPVLRDAAGRIALTPGRLVLLDLRAATFVDSSVVHFAVDLDRRATAQGGGLVIMATPRTKALFGLVGADGLTIVEDERDDALAAGD